MIFYQIPSTYFLWKQCIETSFENLYVDILGLKGLNRRSLLMVDFVFVLVTSSSIYTHPACRVTSIFPRQVGKDEWRKKNRSKESLFAGKSITKMCYNKTVCCLIILTYFCHSRSGSRIFLLRGGALVSCSTSTPINHIVFFLAEYQLY